jgi:polysaccharide export outer membrane protein
MIAMKNQFPGTKHVSKFAGPLFALAAVIAVVSVQTAISQTTLKFAGAGDESPAPGMQPVNIQRSAATPAQKPETGNEVYIFSFSKQQNITPLPMPLKDAVQPARAQSASPLNAAAPGDVYTILAKVGLEAGLPASPSASVADKSPPSAIPSNSAAGDFYAILSQAKRQPGAPVASTPVVAVEPTPVVAVEPAPVVVVEPAPVVAAPTPKPQLAQASVPGDDVFPILANAGRQRTAAPLPSSATALAESRPIVIESAPPELGWRSILAQPSRPTSVPEEPKPLNTVATTESPTPVVVTPAAPVIEPSKIAVQQPAPTPVAPAAPTPVASLEMTESPKAGDENAVPAAEAYSKLAQADREWSPPVAPEFPSTSAVVNSSPAPTSDRLTLLQLPAAAPASTPVVTETSLAGGSVVGTVTCNPGTTPLGSCACPYQGGQSGTQGICGVDCGVSGAPCCSTWSDAHCIPWSLFGPGEYVGPARSEHVSTYYLRVNDLITLTFIASRNKSAQSYRIGVGDRLRLEWLRSAGNNDASLDRDVLVQPDGTITVPLIGEVTAAGKSVKDLQEEVVRLYSRFQRDPQITVTPLEVNIALQDLLKAVTSQSRSSGQALDLRVTPEGTIQAPGLGSVFVQGLTLEELRSELESRYEKTLGVGLLVSPSLTERATSYVFLGGEVNSPGRYTLEGPTTVMQAIALGGGWNNGGNLHQVVVFRRDENWCLKATKIDVRAPYYGKDPCPVNDVWLRDNDLVIVPKQRVLCAADVIELYFTRGVYAVFPITFVRDFSRGSGVVPIGP